MVPTCIQPISPGLGEGVLDCLLLAGAEYGVARGNTGSFLRPDISSSWLELEEEIVREIFFTKNIIPNLLLLTISAKTLWQLLCSIKVGMSEMFI